MLKSIFLSFTLLLVLSACTEKKVPKGTKTTAAMSKCGAGKCGANMLNEDTPLAKKKQKVFSQTQEEDKRRKYVVNTKK